MSCSMLQCIPLLLSNLVLLVEGSFQVRRRELYCAWFTLAASELHSIPSMWMFIFSSLEASGNGFIAACCWCFVPIWTIDMRTAVQFVSYGYLLAGNASRHSLFEVYLALGYES